APVALLGSFTDADHGDVHTARWAFDALEVPGAVTEVGTSGRARGSYRFAAPGLYDLELDVTDRAGATGSASTVDGLSAFVVVYDPNAPFLAAGARLDLAIGDCQLNDICRAASGPASLGIDARYPAGARIPVG